jgi:hypothetical protein
MRPRAAAWSTPRSLAAAAAAVVALLAAAAPAFPLLSGCRLACGSLRRAAAAAAQAAAAVVLRRWASIAPRYCSPWRAVAAVATRAPVAMLGHPAAAPVPARRGPAPTLALAGHRRALASMAALQSRCASRRHRAMGATAALAAFVVPTSSQAARVGERVASHVTGLPMTAAAAVVAGSAVAVAHTVTRIGPPAAVAEVLG